MTKETISILTDKKAMEAIRAGEQARRQDNKNYYIGWHKRFKMKIGKIELGKPPIVCAVLRDNFNSKILSRLKKLHVELIELRVDQFKQLDFRYVAERIRILKRNKFLILLTIRHKSEGGAFHFSEAERFQLFRVIIPIVDLVDIELKSPICKKVVQLAKRRKKPVIVSFHDFHKTPTNHNLDQYWKEGVKLGASVVKIAAFAKSQKDYFRLLDFTIEHPGEVITISMGRVGAPSRVLFPLCGSLLTYGYVNRKTAPGQLSVEQLRKFLK